MSETDQTHTHILSAALQDRLDDCDEILYLLTDIQSRLRILIHDCKKSKPHLYPGTYTAVLAQADVIISECLNRQKGIEKVKQDISGSSPTLGLLTRVRTAVASAREFLRTTQTRTGALITSTDWQSPSYESSRMSQAGRQTGTIYATINDYKRDQHADALRYERAFVKAYIDNWIKFPINAFATSSGMAAFTTILNFLMLEKHDTRPVIIGKSIYFENYALVNSAFGSRVRAVDESDTDAILRAIRSEQPSVIIFDSLTNSPRIVKPDLPAIIPYLVRHAKKETYLVIDNTCLSVMLQPLRYIFGKRSKVRFIMLESLNKYHQFGMDRVTGGIIVSYGGDTLNLFDYRVHLGTNIPDLVAASLPTPDRKTLHRRLVRLGRNAAILASGLQSWVSAHPGCPFTGISYPGLADKPGFSGTSAPFYGSYLTIVWKKQYQTVPVYKRFVAEVMRAARKATISINAGTSFGLDTTRIYLTALRSTPVTPFVRIAAGTEDAMEIENIAGLLQNVITRFTP